MSNDEIEAVRHDLWVSANNPAVMAPDKPTILAAIDHLTKRVVEAERERDEAVNKIEQRFWSIVDRDEIMSVPSDMWNALDRIVRDATRLPDLRSQLAAAQAARDNWFEKFEEQEQLRDNAEQKLAAAQAEVARLHERCTSLDVQRVKAWTQLAARDAAIEKAERQLGEIKPMYDAITAARGTLRQFQQPEPDATVDDRAIATAERLARRMDGTFVLTQPEPPHGKRSDGEVCSSEWVKGAPCDCQPEPDQIGVHMAHCGPLNDGVCAYGDDDCPACQPEPDKLVEADETGWLIELPMTARGGGRLCYVALIDQPLSRWATKADYDDWQLLQREMPLRYTPDSNEALRFARREDAELFMRVFDRFILRGEVHEHQWIAARGGRVVFDGPVVRTGDQPPPISKSTHTCKHHGDNCQEHNLHCQWPACAVKRIVLFDGEGES